MTFALKMEAISKLATARNKKIAEMNSVFMTLENNLITWRIEKNLKLDECMYKLGWDYGSSSLIVRGQGGSFISLIIAPFDIQEYIYESNQLEKLLDLVLEYLRK